MAHNKEQRKQKALSVERHAQEKQIKPLDREKAAYTPLGLPEIWTRFCHAGVDEARLGPRAELTLVLSPLISVGDRGHRGPPIKVRFGGIFNFAEVEAGIAEGHHIYSELAYLRYDTDHNSKLGDIYVHLEFERVEARIKIHCRKLTVTERDQIDI